MIRKEARKVIHLDEDELKELGADKVTLLGRRGFVFIFNEKDVKEIEKGVYGNLSKEEKRKAFRLLFSKLREVKIKGKKVIVPPSVWKDAISR